MLKRLLVVFSLSAALIPKLFACPNALPTNQSGFCPSFKAAAQCYCTSTGLPSGLCQDMKQIVSRMTIVYGSVNNACKNQNHTSSQECVDDWKCYLDGGKNSQGQSCSGTGFACE